MLIRELKIEETEDGYRIEIKGDKERLKQMFEHGPLGFGMGMPFGFGMHHGPRRGGRGPWRWKWRWYPGQGGPEPWGYHHGPHREEDDEPPPFSV